MKKIVIIGSNGAGKTTLANELSPILKIKAYHLDRLFWQRGWRGIDREERIDILQNLTLEKQWIIEGTYINSSECRLEAADTIILLDTPCRVCFLRILNRYRKYSDLSRRDIPEGCTVNITLPRLFKVLTFPLRERRKLQELLNRFPQKVVLLRSSNEVKDFLMQPEAYVEQMRKTENGNQRGPVVQLDKFDLSGYLIITAFGTYHHLA